MRKQGSALKNGQGTQVAGRAAALAAAVLTLAAPVLALGAEPELPAFGMIGLAYSQTAVLNAVLTHVPNTEHPGCWVTMSFVDARGVVFNDRAGRPFKKRVVLRDNIAESLEMPAADILAPFERRKPIRAALRETPDPGAASDCCALTLTLELVGPRGSTGEVELPRIPNPPNPLCVLPGP
jgi:hypothetical protein